MIVSPLRRADTSGNMLGRRAFLTGTVAAAVLAACAGESDGETSPATATNGPDADTGVVNNDIANEPTPGRPVHSRGIDHHALAAGSVCVREL